MRKRPESVLTKNLSGYLREHFPEVPFHFDLFADMPMPKHLAIKNKALHGKWSRGWPDLFIARATGKFGGLYLELKASDTVPNSEHTRRQALIHEILRKNGYKVSFCCGYADCKKKIKKYLKST